MTAFFLVFVLIVLNVVWINGVYDISLVPRLFTLLAFLAIIVPLGLVLRFTRRFDFAILRNPIILCYGAYALTTCFSLFVALNVTAGLNDVFKTLASLVVLCLTCLLLESTRNWVGLVCKIFVAAAVMAAGIGYYQMISRFGFGIHPREVMAQVDGLMSNANLYASILNLILPPCLCGILILRGPWRLVSFLAASGLLLLLALLQTRAAYLGLAGGTVAVAAVLFFYHEKFAMGPRRRYALAALLLVLFCLVIGSAFMTGNPLAQRVRSLFALDYRATDGGRLMIWKITLGMIADHPWLGVGAGNFTIRLQEYFGAAGQNLSVGVTNWAQPHNDPLWILAEKGGLGFLAFAGFVCAAFWQIRAIFRRATSSDQRWMALAILMGLCAYLLDSCFDFPSERINHQVYLSVYLAMAVVLNHSPAPALEEKQRCSPLGTLPWWVAPPIVLTLALGVTYAAAALRQERYVCRARVALKEEDWPEVLANARLATTRWKTLDPVATPVAYLEGVALWQMNQLPEATAALERARTHNPNRCYLINTLGLVYLDGGKPQQALACFLLATHRYPDRLDVIENAAKCEFQLQRFAECVAHLEKIPQSARTPSMTELLEAAQGSLKAAPRNSPRN